MKIFEFTTRINSDGTLTIPPEVLADLEGEDEVTIQLWAPKDINEDKEWAALSAEQFLKDSDEEDSIYDDLSGG